MWARSCVGCRLDRLIVFMHAPTPPVYIKVARADAADCCRFVCAGARLCWEANLGGTPATAALLGYQAGGGKAAPSAAVALEMAWAAVASTLYTAQAKQRYGHVPSLLEHARPSVSLTMMQAGISLTCCVVQSKRSI